MGVWVLECVACAVRVVLRVASVERVTLLVSWLVLVTLGDSCGDRDATGANDFDGLAQPINITITHNTNGNTVTAASGRALSGIDNDISKHPLDKVAVFVPGAVAVPQRHPNHTVASLHDVANVRMRLVARLRHGVGDVSRPARRADRLQPRHWQSLQPTPADRGQTPPMIHTSSRRWLSTVRVSPCHATRPNALCRRPRRNRAAGHRLRFVGRLCDAPRLLRRLRGRLGPVRRLRERMRGMH